MQLVDKQTIFNGRKIRLELRHYQPDGDGPRHTREVVVHPGAVVILPMLDEQTVVMIRSRRYAVDATLWELPAGTLEKGELPINCAGRELVEETGYLAGRMLPLGTFYASPGILTERMHTFLGLDLEKTEAAPEEGEEIEVVPTPLDEVLEMIRSGEIADAKTIATVLKYVQFGDTVKR